VTEEQWTLEDQLDHVGRNGVVRQGLAAQKWHRINRRSFERAVASTDAHNARTRKEA